MLGLLKLLENLVLDDLKSLDPDEGLSAVDSLFSILLGFEL